MATDYGSDFAGITDLDPALTVVTGITCFAQALARRLTQIAGGLVDDPSYGYDIRLELNSTTPLQRIQQRCAAELRKDERVDNVSVSATRLATQEGDTIALEIGVIPADPDDAPFEFTLNVSALTATLILAH